MTFLTIKESGVQWRRDRSTPPIKPFDSGKISPDLEQFMLAMDFSWTDINYDQAKVDFRKNVSLRRHMKK
ncbi:unnamed protein product [Pylaiella littoralis]